jgi:cobalt-zinc-cadmium efflux system protein
MKHSHSHSHDAHGHHSSHAHHHAPKNFDRAFAIGVLLNTGFVGVEVVFGLMSNSLALLADAGHNLSDVLALLLAWGAGVLARKQPTQRHTYGLRRSSVLAALVNALVLLVAVGAIAWEAALRLGHPEAVQSGTVIGVASLGILVNGFTAWLFMSGKEHDVNIKGAYLHMAADAAVSLGVVLAAVAMQFTGWLWLDPVMSLGISVVIGVGTWGLLRESLNLALDAVPATLDAAKVESYFASLPGITAVHDLHIWAMSTTEVALTVHLVKPDARLDDALLTRINNDVHAQFNIEHITVQFEVGDPAHPCKQAPVEVL